MDNNRLSEIQRNIGYAFNDESLLEQAFCHSSYARQHGLDDNERMEFFGDAVLEYIVSEYLFDNYPEFDQGQLSKVRALLVSADGLRPVVDRMDIMRFLLVADNAAQIKNQSKKSKPICTKRCCAPCTRTAEWTRLASLYWTR